MNNKDSDETPAMINAIDEASALMNKGEWSKASELWRDIVYAKYTSMPRGVYARLAASYGKQDLYEDVQTVFDDALKKNAISPDLIREVVKSYQAQDNSPRAREIIMQAARKTKKPDEKRQYLSMVAAIDGDNSHESAAVQILNGLIKSFGSEPVSNDVKATAAFVTKRIDKLTTADDWDNYWRLRKKFVYLHVCRRLVEVIAASANAVADIGSNGSPILDFYGDIESKFSVDIDNPYQADGVISVVEDFYVWEPPVPIQVATCLQVIEHVPDPAKFCRRMLELFELSIVSVPFMEPAGLNLEHINNDINLETLISWFGRAPNFHYIAQELSGEERIICVYDRETEDSFPNLHEQGLMAQKFMYRWSIEDFGG
ncbi:tetratricopeptide repeat protein [Robiginitomaculum antarcticum]|uniref:tetratricopeptide repeat protein n=1 Tax=Robiginitomaculum antarcticum TaxID=437507 RepID=UPI00036C0A34|nr:hypothetical protein [Robiginitomaculum antarcticum]